jgi:ParB family chromosome partitioning protein
LGRGLGALISDSTPEEAGEEATRGIEQIKVARIHKSSQQPRRRFDQEALAELTASIREHGVLQPLLVRAMDEGYELIAGERRLRAATDAGLEQVPAIVMEASDSDAMELALIENLQREDLNAIEEAEGYRVLAERFDMTQEQIAARVGKARASVANALRLLALPEEVKRMIADDMISAGHAKLLSGLSDDQAQVALARRTIDEGLSVRNLEKLIKRFQEAPRKPRASRADFPASHVAHISDRLHTHFGTSVRLSPCRTYANGKKGKGTIEIDFYSNEELDRLLGILGVEID